MTACPGTGRNAQPAGASRASRAVCPVCHITVAARFVRRLPVPAHTYQERPAR